MRKKIIGLDLDDVLMDFNTGLCVFHNAYYGTKLTREHITSYLLEEIWRVPQSEVIRRVNEFYFSIHHKATPPTAGAVRAVKQLQARHEVVVITSRPESVSAQTYAWLKKHFPSLVVSVHHAGHFFHKEGAGTKGELCQRLGVEVFVDDAFHHVEDVAPVVAQALLFDAPWNRSYTLSRPNMQRIHSWDAICRVIEES